MRNIIGLYLFVFLLGSGCSTRINTDLGNEYGFSSGSESESNPSMITVQPIEIDSILDNPGRGFSEFHGVELPLNQHPTSTVAYYRWTWAELEPAPGQYNFDVVDKAILAAKAKGQTLAFRILPHWRESPIYDSSPQWLLDLGVSRVAVTDGVFPDHNDALFLEHHERLVRAFGARYAGSPDIDHIDIGSVGCWGEWNTACCEKSLATCELYYPTEENQQAIVDWYLQSFAGTPLVIPIGGAVEYAVSNGTGWRADCFGDYGMFDINWNHMDDTYGPATADPLLGEAWKTAPVHFEVCGVMQDWYTRGYDINLILRKGLAWHMSVLNAKSSPVPEDWRVNIDEFDKKLGYRFVLKELSHTAIIEPNGTLVLNSQWENIGVAPIYHPWHLAYRLRNQSDQVVAEWTSDADLREWLPGYHEVQDAVILPGEIPAGTYFLDVAILTEDKTTAHVKLAIEGLRTDGWYEISELMIER
ncbi:MAG: DUF4832 domain-containing protein [Anaerolineaceae bacterium]|nr:DUF4832 domain-containing protein [Anaerolineaceae bacterium]